jgi:hypothetical protein
MLGGLRPRPARRVRSSLQRPFGCPRPTLGLPLLLRDTLRYREAYAAFVTQLLGARRRALGSCPPRSTTYLYFVVDDELREGDSHQEILQELSSETQGKRISVNVIFATKMGCRYHSGFYTLRKKQAVANSRSSAGLQHWRLLPAFRLVASYENSYQTLPSTT